MPRVNPRARSSLILLRRLNDLPFDRHPDNHFRATVFPDHLCRTRARQPTRQDALQRCRDASAAGYGFELRDARVVVLCAQFVGAFRFRG